MEWLIDPRNGIPIYVQLRDLIKRAIATGWLQPGTQLPTVRQLAVNLKINPNTVARVYSELEREGYLQTRQGKGTFVAQGKKETENQRDSRFSRIIDEALIAATELGYSPKEVIERIRERLGEVEEEDGN
ncbi:MAG: GntR family transcriptional regulator [Firmicutes bacterium]|nr:GntR family transcriptional regulator [Bacillota bacterium]